MTLQLEGPPTAQEHDDRALGLAYDTSTFMIRQELINHFEEMAEAATEVVSWAAESANDDEPQANMIIGIDVSGRVPALILHKVLLLAHADGYINTLPSLQFIASGSAPSLEEFAGMTSAELKELTDEKYKKLDDQHGKARDEHKVKASENITSYVRQMIGSTGVKNVLIVDDFVSTGNSMSRIGEALKKAGLKDIHYITVGVEELWLGREGAKGASRRLVGVEDNGTEATTIPYPYATDKEKEEYAKLSDRFMLFLEEYAAQIYRELKENNFASEPTSADDARRVTDHVPKLSKSRPYF